MGEITRRTRIAFSQTGGGAQLLVTHLSFQDALGAIKEPKAGTELFCFVVTDDGNYGGFRGQNVAERFRLVADEIAGLAMERLVKAGCPYKKHFGDARQALMRRNAGGMTQVSFKEAAFYPFIDFRRMAQSKLGEWLVHKKEISEGRHHGPVSDREQELWWAMARVIHWCLSPDLHDQIAGVQKYYDAIAHCGDFRKQIAIAEKTLAICLRDLYYPYLGDCFRDMLSAAK